MQVILTEQEYLKLKNQSDEDKKTYVKRVDVGIALIELDKKLRRFFDFSPVIETESEWRKAFEKFIKDIQ